MKQIRKRLTYANVMSSIAVFLVLGGATAVAAGQLGKNSVGSKQLKKNAVTSAKIKNNAVTTAKIKNGAISGAKVNVGSLGTVPNASHSGSADNAGNSNTVGGVGAQELSFSADGGTQTVYDRGGLRITATCSGNDITVTATTTKENSSIYSSVVDTDSDDNNLNEDEETEAFDTGEDFDLLAGNDGNPGLVTFAYDAKDGTTVNGTFSVDESADPDCQLHGVAFNA